ncbi:MAG: BBP7 family outer membrane beta-barrel protein, partial [Thermogutta sp.]|uniref:BBP7 family outer membrane beta-barrel protein n=1 Tax=Thermogutta sp. TaxID=1962930 RepID=UPI0019A51F80
GYVDPALTDIQNLPVTFNAPFIEDLEPDEGGDPDTLPEPSWGVMMENLVKNWSTELNYVYRFHPTRRGTIWELFLGVRYFELNEDFNVWAPYSYVPYDPTLDQNDPNGVGFPTAVGILADSYWFTKAENHVVGPQIGGRLFRSYNRWTFDVQARFFAGFNFQNIKQQGVLGSRLTPGLGAIEDVPLFMRATGFSHSATEEEWAPCAELRATIKYQVTSKINLSVGWTGLWMDGIARASNMILYRVPDMGITMEHNTQDLFINGVTAGVEFNR